jgi:cytoplasmic iron level regulating protein YaaA (DUF328/UPF0246 family)
MLLVLSPAKSLDFDSTLPTLETTVPQFLDDSSILNQALRKLTPDDLF